MSKEKTIHERMSEIQRELKAPKGQFNAFGKYNYRSCEDILEAVKPLLKEGEYLRISDKIELIGDRFYIKATAQLCKGADSIEATAYAREPLNKKGMDESQITGATSSYSKKYALNGLFAIDDNKDADATNKHDQENKPEKHVGGSEFPASEKQKKLISLLNSKVNNPRPKEKIDSIKTAKQASAVIDQLNKEIEDGKSNS